MQHVRRAVIGASAALAVAIALAAGGTGVAAAAPASPAAPASTALTPSLAEQNADADHVMGATNPDASAPRAAPTPTVGTAGFDVSYYQGDDTTPAADGSLFRGRVAAQVAGGARFAFVKTTEGTPGRSASGNPTGTSNSRAAVQYADLKAAGLFVGTYHYALPYYSPGPAQARFFLDHSPAWTADGVTLPPVLDMEVNTAGAVQGGSCWGLSQADMVSWIQGWIATVVAAEGVQPVIYTNQDFWNTCTGNSAAFPKDRLWVASYSGTSTTPVAPTGLRTWLYWQWREGTVIPASTTATPVPGADTSITSPNLDVFNGSASGLRTLATGGTRSVGRLAGGNAYATAGAVAASAFTPSATLDGSSDATTRAPIALAYIATRSAYPDALSAAAAAGYQRAPVLLTDPNTLPAATAAELAQLQPRHIVIVGGGLAVSSTVERQLAKYTTKITRLQGTSRYNTSAAIAATAFPAWSSAAYPNGLTAYIATGTNFPDALAGAAVAAGTASGPMLLVKPTSIDASIQAQLRRLHPTRIVILGGGAAVSSTVQQQLAQYVSGGASSMARWAGNNRFDTSVVIAQQAFRSGASTAFVATGTNFPDALAGGPAAGHFGAPVLLVRPDSVQANVRSELTALRTRGVVVLGGPAAVGAAVEASF